MAAPNGPGFCKPEDVLVDTMRPIHLIEWMDVISVLEFKYRDTKALMEDAMNYMLEIAQFILTNQIDRQYFVGLLMLGTNIFVYIYTHGGLSITTPINMYHDINDFINCMVWFKHADLELLSYDNSIIRNSHGFRMALHRDTKLVHGAMTNIVSVIYNSNSTFGRSTRILGLTYQCTPADTDNLIIKDVW
ncbi:uncharacterized protein HD556DRAFT_1306395 [Suillus plorans]|uniref:Fungal-type protein kinase domain-containing protein n=1 Tax=Suillus plorans TaxID=116603 RepID=A0A9P7DLH6_9AGAM|nr:uncharacterized protein HD556DRAFT_1306395 [Suillus plorans]KAG1797800.1 hypothetical protein HD556DRAFT_1306395 [Suillus plorans]